MFLKVLTIAVAVIAVNGQSKFTKLFSEYDFPQKLFSDGYFRDYYWRDYVIDIPSDAYEGGENENGTTYIGQVLDLVLSPVEIRRGHRTVYIPNEHPLARTALIKVSGN